MILGKRIFSEEGLVLLAPGVELTAKLIARLEQCGVGYVYIEDPKTADIVIPELISDETRQYALKEIRTAFKEIMNRPEKRRGVTYPYVAKPFKTIMKMILDELGGRQDAMIMLLNMETTDHYLFQHSLNVCIYTSLLGIARGYTTDELTILGLGALLHDVGKTQIPPSVLLKPGALSQQEYALMKQHTTHGFRLLKDEPNVPLIVAHCALQHHERLDGSGYPRGIRGDDIHEYAKLLGIVDSYDAMTTSRVYRSAMLPHQAVESLYAGSGTLYDQGLLQLFRDRVAIYPIGLTVRLSTGERGVVVDLNATYSHRPIVRVLYDEAGNELAVPYETDLSKVLTTMIVGVNEENENQPAAAG